MECEHVKLVNDTIDNWLLDREDDFDLLEDSILFDIFKQLCGPLREQDFER